MPRGKKNEGLVSKIRRWLVAPGAHGIGSGATGHWHECDDEGAIECEECANANGLIEIEPREEPAKKADAKAETPPEATDDTESTEPATGQGELEPVDSPSAEPAPSAS